MLIRVKWNNPLRIAGRRNERQRYRFTFRRYSELPNLAAPIRNDRRINLIAILLHALRITTIKEETIAVI